MEGGGPKRQRGGPGRSPPPRPKGRVSLGGQLEIDVFERRPAHFEAFELLAARRAPRRSARAGGGSARSSARRRSRRCGGSGSPSRRCRRSARRASPHGRSGPRAGRRPGRPAARPRPGSGSSAGSSCRASAGCGSSPRRCAARRVEAGRRLVEEEQLRVADEREPEVEAALLAARERAARAPPPSRSGRRSRSPRRVPRASVVAAEHRQALAHRQVRIERRGLEHDADALPPGAGRRAADPRRAPRRRRRRAVR